MQHIKPNRPVQQQRCRAEACHTGQSRHTAGRRVKNTEGHAPLPLTLAAHVLVGFHLIGDRVDDVAICGVDRLGRADNLDLGHARRARMRALATFLSQHRPLLRLITQVQQHAGKGQGLLAVDLHAKADVAAANDVREGGVKNALQNPSPSDACSLVRPRLLELADDGYVGNRHPLDGSRHVFHETYTNRVEFVR